MKVETGDVETLSIIYLFILKQDLRLLHDPQIRYLKALASRVFELRVDQAEADERCSKSNFFSFSFFMCLSPVQSQVLHGFFFDKCNIFIISSCQKLPLKGSKTKTKTFSYLLFLIVFEVQGYHYFQNKRSDQNQFLR